MINRNRLHHARQRLEKKAFMGMPMPWGMPGSMPMPWGMPVPGMNFPMMNMGGGAPWWQSGQSQSPFASIFDTDAGTASVTDLSIFDPDIDPLVARGQQLGNFGELEPFFSGLSPSERAIFEGHIRRIGDRLAYLRSELPRGLAAGETWAKNIARRGYDPLAEGQVEAIWNMVRADRFYRKMLEEGYSPQEAARRLAAYTGRNLNDPDAVAAAGAPAALAEIYRRFGSDDPVLLQRAKEGVYAIRALVSLPSVGGDPLAAERLRNHYRQRFENARTLLGDEQLRSIAERQGIDYDQFLQGLSSPASSASTPASTASPTTASRRPLPSVDVAQQPNQQQGSQLSPRSTGIYPGPSRASKYL